MIHSALLAARLAGIHRYWFIGPRTLTSGFLVSTLLNQYETFPDRLADDTLTQAQRRRVGGEPLEGLAGALYLHVSLEIDGPPLEELTWVKAELSPDGRRLERIHRLPRPNQTLLSDLFCCACTPDPATLLDLDPDDDLD